MDEIAAVPAMAPAMALAISASFGSFARWRGDLDACLRTLAGSGSVSLDFDPTRGTLGHRTDLDRSPADEARTILRLAAPTPLPVGGDAGAARTLDAVVATIDWDDAYRRYQHAVELASASFGAGPDALGQALLLDVRRAGVFEQAQTMLPGASWRDPAAVGDWAGALPAGRPLVVYCVYGHEVGRATALRLRAAGRDARFLEGGIDGWQRAGRPLTTKGDKP